MAIPAASPIFRGKRSSSCRWPTRPCWQWTCWNGAGTSAASRVRAASTWQASSRRSSRPAIAVRCRWRSSTTASAPRRPAPTPSTACARCSTSRRRPRAPATADAARGGGRAVRAAAASLCDGIEFLEFAVDETLGARLGQWLQRLGFARAGEHRSKNVSLLRQGDINLVLNAEPYSFAHGFFEAHGPSLCATALRVRDAGQALERARAYGGQPYRGLLGPNEREIPAVRALDGSLLYLVERHTEGRSIYDSDFVTNAPTPPASACGASTTWPWRCPPKAWTAGCCSTRACSTSAPMTRWCCRPLWPGHQSRRA